MVVQKLQRKRKNNLVIGVIYLSIILVGLNVLTYAQKTKNVSKSDDYKYKIGQSVPIIQENKLFLTISIERKEYTYENLIATIKFLKCSYSNFEKLNIIILDSYDSAKRLTAVQQNNPNYDKDQAAVRGFYYFDGAEKIEYIEFSTRKNRSKKRYELNNSLIDCKSVKK